MGGVSDKKLKNRTLQLRAGSEYIELIELAVEVANEKAIMIGKTQMFNNSDILKEAIKGLTGNNTYIDIEGNRFDIKELVNSRLEKFDGEFQNIIGKEELKDLLKISAIRFINDSARLLEDAIDDMILDKKSKNTVMITETETELEEVKAIIGRVGHYNIEDFITFGDVYDEFDKFISDMYNSNTTSKLRIIDDKEIDVEELNNIQDERIKADLKLIAKYSCIYSADYEMKLELEEYITECILDSEEFNGINAYKLKNDYNQRKIMTRVKAIIETYINDITRD